MTDQTKMTSSNKYTLIAVTELADLRERCAELEKENTEIKIRMNELKNWKLEGADEIVRQATRAERAEAERDLAIAHDRQPYPTAYAYEKTCELLHKAEADLAEEMREHKITVDNALKTEAERDAAYERCALHFQAMPTEAVYTKDEAAACCRALKENK